jgi:hypothetical protein
VLPGGVPAASAAALSGAAAAASEGAPNALRNGGYERLNDTGFPEDWRSYVFSGSPSFAADDSVAIEGSRSLRITASAYSRGTVYQDVRIPAEERGLYRFRQWIKTEEATATAYARLFLINATGGRVGNLI